MFIHLRNYSSYSLCFGATTVDKLVFLAKSAKMPALAITDKGNLFGSLEFAMEAVKSGIQPIIGISIKINLAEDNYDEILLIAKNEIGYKNLLNIASSAFLEGEKSINIEKLNNHKEGLIALIGYREGEIYKLLEQNQKDKAETLINEYLGIFSGHLYIELSRLGYEGERVVEAKLLNIAKEKNIPITATNEVAFAKQDLAEAQDILNCIATNQYFEDPSRKKLALNHYFKSAREMESLFKDLPEALENTVNIAKRCSYYPTPKNSTLPSFSVSEGRTEEEELAFQANEGLKKRIEGFSEEDSKPYFERLEYELGIINKMGFPGYFLIVSDFIKWSKDNNISVGPGRGSGAGSMVAWSLEITDLDPLRFGLLFERFLNPERVSMPDFDIDFCQERREEVIDYVISKYGRERVAQIITFGKLQAKAVLKDVGRVLQLPYKQVDRICKMVPFNPVDPVTLDKAIKMDPSLQKERDSDPQIKKLLDIGLKLEGLHRHASTHAAGIVISNEELIKVVPLYKDPRSDIPVVQYSMKYTECSGLVKFDFLGLKTLTTIAKTIEQIKLQGGDLDINTIPEQDQKTFDLLGTGNSIGIFQLESAGMRDCLKKMAPDKIEDLIALISLYRPGPMDNIPQYIASKHGKIEVEYPHPLLEKCLKETFGVIIYQEQVMEIAQILGGYTLGQADLLRRAMGKKIKAEMDAQKETFIKGAVANNIDKKKAGDIFELVAKFAGYGFNKSHAAAYAKIGYQTAFLKANYPVEFITATLNIDINDTDKINVFIQEAKNLNIKILPPDINESDAYFKIVEFEGGKAIRYGLAALKATGTGASTELVKARSDKKFKNLHDLIARCGTKIIQKRLLESLIKSGATDCLNLSRSCLLSSVDLITKHTQAIEQEKNSNQSSLFGAVEDGNSNIELRKAEEFTLQEKLKNEFEALGFYLTEHPLDRIRPILDESNISYSKEIRDITAESHDFTAAGAIMNYKQRSGKKGRFVTLSLSDPEGILDLSIFDEEIISEARDILVNGSIIYVKANLRNDENSSRIMVNSLKSIEDFMQNKAKIIELNLENTTKLSEVTETLQKNPGNIGVVLKLNYQKQGQSFSIETGKKFLTNVETYQKLVNS